MAEQLITVGKITTTQGHLGEVRVYPLTDFPERFERLETVGCQVNDEFYWLTIENVRYHKEFIILRFKEIANMNQAERLKGGLLQIKAQDLMPLPEGHYYIFQLLGLTVLTVDNEFLGVVQDIKPTGSNDVYYVRHPENGQETLIPALKQFVKEINLEEGRIIVEIPPGLND
ncbi:ribosome maturation factor RimM [Zhaonella formicivorans]|uniref:ribosome maturation factor RimM n=1 Tax=Zhaonella formicivorans TaxID=2528593 RepID=UPI0010DC241D|nr:ribosome maturation factor RimM [Zhaonella formicivorans]